MQTATTSRVAEHTPEDVNRRIRAEITESIAYHAVHREEIPRRLEELEDEWDIERTLEANAASLMLAGVLMGAFVGRGWWILPGVVSAFLLQHAVQGWCPPLPVFRRLGVRTAKEIATERYALKALRGDLDVLDDRDSRDDAHRVANELVSALRR